MKGLSHKFKDPHHFGVENGGWCGEKYAKTHDGFFVGFIPEEFSGTTDVFVVENIQDDEDKTVVHFEFDNGHEHAATQLANTLAEVHGWTLK